MSELTEKQSQVLAFIRSMIENKHRPPTVREIQRHLNTENIGTVQAHLFALVKKEKIRIQPNIARGIDLVEQKS